MCTFSRWKNICILSAERKKRILLVWTLLQEVLNLYEEHKQWVESQEQILHEIDNRREQKSQEQIQDLIALVEVSNLKLSWILFIFAM
jgi:hypothetical protein